ncbi:hypothetical protein [Streptomyces lancefieldiae]|uniref:Uncharacterized protein n=1 Tax=Streptomyces lancefieldiae TaxID=3075520 RepID=A0ABU3B0H5_9ACTN|nr:hypothetical protein [Streptomyces sp. DSM 40712]MDT0615941.1 hypothetical protein [Streptomyces sp. DSM 40712]
MFSAEPPELSLVRFLFYVRPGTSLNAGNAGTYRIRPARVGGTATTTRRAVTPPPSPG